MEGKCQDAEEKLGGIDDVDESPGRSAAWRRETKSSDDVEGDSESESKGGDSEASEAEVSVFIQQLESRLGMYQFVAYRCSHVAGGGPPRLHRNIVVSKR